MILESEDHRMTNRNAEPTQEYAGGAPPPPPPPLPPPPTSSLSRDQPDGSHHRGGNMVFKSGPLFLSSKGIGWTSWKKRWFILTSTSLVFFRSDPSALPQKGSEVNLTLGGIDLNNSGSVVVKTDKKLLTVLFPDGRDGRAFTLKAETLEDLQEWKAALENALAQAPSAGHSMGQNGVFKNDQTDSLDGTSDPSKSRLPARSTVLGRPLLLALEDVDGTPSFLEKALKFMEEHGVKVEGILRQAADVDDVEGRIREYEQGKSEFSPEEDAHVIGDCVKYVLRELPSSPVPASCCNALLEACRTDRSVRVNAMRTAIYETFPEPNRRLLQRILMMMQSVAAHKAENRMSTSAVAACMAPLLLRPLLSGDCEIESDFNVGGDGSIQLLQAAAAANHAQAIVITLLEEYNSIFGCLQEGSMSTELYSDTEDSGSESGEATDDELSYDGEEQEYTSGSDSIYDEDAKSETCSEDANSGDNDLYDNKMQDSHGSTFISKSTRVYDKTKSNRETLPSQIDKDHSTENVLNQDKSSSNIQDNKFAEALGDVSRDASLIHRSFDRDPSSHIQHSATMSNGNDYNSRRRTVWGRTAAKKNLSMESIDYSIEDEVDIQQFEARKRELQNKIAEEVKENAILQVGLERRKKALHEHRQALEQDVAKLQERLLKERALRTALEAGLKGSQFPLPSVANIDEKTKAELEEISVLEVDIVNLKQKMDGLVMQLDQQHQTKKDELIDADVIHQSYIERSKSKETNLDKKGNENGRKLEPALIASKNSPQNQNLNSVRNSVGIPIDFSAAEPERGRCNAPVISKRSSIRGEGANSTSSALTSLTTRLNFLKERRSQIANELQNMDEVRVSSQPFEYIEKNKGSEPDISTQNSENSRGSAAHSIQNREKGRTLDYFQSLQTSENVAVNAKDTRKSYADVEKKVRGSASAEFKERKI